MITRRQLFCGGVVSAAAAPLAILGKSKLEESYVPLPSNKKISVTIDNSRVERVMQEALKRMIEQETRLTQIMRGEYRRRA